MLFKYEGKDALSEKSGNAGREPKSIDTLIGAGMRIDGDVVCDGVLRVQGDIVGNVFCKDNPAATLIIDSAGSVTGAVDMPRVALRGRLVGPVQSRQSIEVHQGGSLLGDIVFTRIAIHAGGVVEGLCTPAAEPANELQSGASKDKGASAAGTGPSPARRGAGWMLGAASAVIAAVATGAWIFRHSDIVAPADKAESQAASVPVAADATASAPAVAVAVSSAPPVAVVPPSVPVSPDGLAMAQEAPPADVADIQEKPHESITAVKGINPSRPAGMFLLISNEPSVLYRKMRDEPGEGAKVVVPAGEKASVAIARNELIRVAQGRDVVILFQGAKVPLNVIESGAWISFVPR